MIDKVDDVSPRVQRNKTLIQQYHRRSSRQRETIGGLAWYGSMTRRQSARVSSYAKLSKDRETIAGRNLQMLRKDNIVIKEEADLGRLINERSYFELAGRGRSMYRAIRGEPSPRASRFQNEAKVREHLAAVEVATLIEEQSEFFKVFQWEGYGLVKYEFDIRLTQTSIEPDARCLLTNESGEILQFLLEIVQEDGNYEDIRTKAYKYCMYFLSEDYIKDLGRPDFPPVLWVAESCEVKKVISEKIVAGVSLAGMTPRSAGNQIVFAVAQLRDIAWGDVPVGRWDCVLQHSKEVLFSDIFDLVNCPPWAREDGYLFR